MSEKPKSPTVFALFRTLLMPMLVGKTLVLWFGSRYTLYPGEGYGYWFAGSILFTLSGFAWFIWKYRDSSES